MPQADLPYIPEYITVHLGTPDSNAENVTVPFSDYIKNVLSSEIYPTWPENAIRANAYAVISYALNRIYTEWYRSRGYDFDITGSTQYDQAYNKDGQIYENISLIVDELFDDYLVRRNSLEPLFASFCNGTTSTCDGLSQWGSVTLAENGLTPLQILQSYYGEDVEIVENAPVRSQVESFRGVPLSLGSVGNDVRTIQVQLNRIARNYPAIPRIPEENGIFDLQTEQAVRKFQEIFGLDQSGTVDKQAWYTIKRYYTGVKGLSDLYSEGISLQEAQLPFEENLTIGMSGGLVRLVQYYLRVLEYFNPDFLPSNFDGSFTEQTSQAVKRFQELYGLNPTGSVNFETLSRLTEVYNQLVGSLSAGYSGRRAKLFDGTTLTEGSRGQAVVDLQTYLSLIGQYYDALPKLPVTGYFGTQTEQAVRTFQQLFGLEPNGAVGPLTWLEIAEEYDFLVETEEI